MTQSVIGIKARPVVAPNVIGKRVLTTEFVNETATDAPGPETAAGIASTSRAGRNSYGQIFRSSALIGGSSAVNIGLGILRTKTIAILLGPNGVGLMGLYGSVADLAQNIAGMGVSSSGVRQIAEAVGSGNVDRLAQRVSVLRRTCALLGAIGAALVVGFSRQISELTFGTSAHAGAVALLSIVVFLRCVTNGQSALIQGLRRVSDMAKIGVLGTLFGSLATILLVSYLREDGVVPALIAGAAVTTLASWWYSRKLAVAPAPMTLSEVRLEATSLLKLGFAFMMSSFIGIGVAYAIRIMVLRKVGYDAAGLYQSAWTLGSFYIGFILQAMGTDFLPRLTAVASDDGEANRLVNEQALVCLLVAGPGVLATFVLAPVVLELFYSTHFHAAVGILRWICLGMILRAVTWPMSFILVARNKRKLFVGADLAWGVVHAGVAYVAIAQLGLNGAGVAFFAASAFYWLLIYPMVRASTGFRWSADNKHVGAVAFLSIAISFSGFYVFSTTTATIVGGVALCLVSFHSLRFALKLVQTGALPASLQMLVRRFGAATAT